MNWSLNRSGEELSRGSFRVHIRLIHDTDCQLDTCRIYRKRWAASALKAAGKASGLRESRIAMDETQTRVVDELTNRDGPTFAKLMTMAEREIGAFISAVTELFGSEQARLAAEDWLDELVLIETLPGLTSRDWRLITIAASARLANRVNASSHPNDI
jgi:hypothetical protein